MGDACEQADEAGVEPAANPLATVLRQVDQSCRALPDALGGIPEERLTVPGAVGELPIKDVMAHVAFWDDHAVVVQRIRAGEPLRDDDWQAMNAQEADARAGHVAAERRTVMERAH